MTRIYSILWLWGLYWTVSHKPLTLWPSHSSINGTNFQHSQWTSASKATANFPNSGHLKSHKVRLSQVHSLRKAVMAALVLELKSLQITALIVMKQGNSNKMTPEIKSTVSVLNDSQVAGSFRKRHLKHLRKKQSTSPYKCNMSLLWELCISNMGSRMVYIYTYVYHCHVHTVSKTWSCDHLGQDSAGVCNSWSTSRIRRCLPLRFRFKWS